MVDVMQESYHADNVHRSSVIQISPGQSKHDLDVQTIQTIQTIQIWDLSAPNDLDHENWNTICPVGGSRCDAGTIFLEAVSASSRGPPLRVVECTCAGWITLLYTSDR